MSIPNSTNCGAPTEPALNQERVLAALASRGRRKLLVALAVGGPQTADALKHVGKARRGGMFSGPEHFADSTVKNLKVMVDAGIVVKLENPQDGRRTLYALPAGVKVEIQADQTVVDIGSFVARLDPDGN